MSVGAIRNTRSMMWLTVGLTAGYALFFVLTLPADSPSKVDALLFWEGLFAGPMMIGCVRSILMARVEARIVLLGFAVAYSILTALVFYCTFAFEHDAGYQLALLLVPPIGYLGVVAAGLSAAFIR
jgi:hypothetical protein